MKALFVLLLMLCSVSAYAVQPDEMLEDPALEARAREISKELRCLVCQGEAIDESDAALAKDLRLLVRERLKEGDSNEEVVDYLRERYGDYVTFRPPLSGRTVLLWFAPVLALLAGMVAVCRALRSS